MRRLERRQRRCWIRTVGKGVALGDNIIVGPAKTLRTLNENDPVKKMDKTISKEGDADKDDSKASEK